MLFSEISLQVIKTIYSSILPLGQLVQALLVVHLDQVNLKVLVIQVFLADHVHLVFPVVLGFQVDLRKEKLLWLPKFCKR